MALNLLHKRAQSLVVEDTCASCVYIIVAVYVIHLGEELVSEVADQHGDDVPFLDAPAQVGACDAQS